MSAPRTASIIIPTYNRHDSLLAALATLSSQECDLGQFEVIVVDDGSSDATAQISHTDFPFKLRYMRQENQGSAVARNTGAAMARGELLIFIDDDMRLEPNYVDALIALHKRHERVVGMGIELPCLPADASIFARVMSNIGNDSWQRDVEEVTVDFTHCVTNNISVMHSDFECIGRMQDLAGDGPTWWGDVDFGYRAKREGFRFLRSQQAICYHCDYSIQDLTTASERAQKTAEMVHCLQAKYPEILNYLPMFEDKQSISWGNDDARMTLRKMTRRIMSTEVGLANLERTATIMERIAPNDKILRPLYRWILGGYIYRGYQRGLRSLTRQGHGSITTFTGKNTVR